MRRITLLVTAAALVAALLPAGAQAGAVFQIVNNDGPGEGFNDPTPWTPAGGNPATTLGQARLNAFTYAADIWGGLLQSSVVIRVAAQMDPLTCTSTGAVLGSAGTTTVYRDFSGAPFADTYYCSALAKALADGAIPGGTDDINATFNSSINGDAGCLGGAEWYYGYDRAGGAGTIDFVSVVLHELGHGLGFQTFVNLSTGTPFNGRNDAYMLRLDQAGASPSDYPSMSDAQRVAASQSDPDLRWMGGNTYYMEQLDPKTAGKNGGYVRMFAPNPQQPGSSVSHWHSDVEPHEIMEPSFTVPIHDPGLALYLMKDIGWTLDASVGILFRDVAATPRDGAVTVSWRYEADEPLLGFNVYRLDRGRIEPRLLNTELLPAGATGFTDTDVVPGAYHRYHVAAVRPDHSEVRSPAVPVTVDLAMMDLAQNQPNPFNAATEVRFSLDRPGDVRLRIYDLSGRLVRTLLDGERPAGSHAVMWHGRDDAGRNAPSGTYVYRLEHARGFESKRMTLLK